MQEPVVKLVELVFFNKKGKLCLPIFQMELIRTET